MNKKLTIALVDKLEKLIDEREDIFFAERPFLEDPTQPLKVILSERRKQNELETEKTAEALGKEMAKDLSIKTPTGEQAGLQGIS